MEREEFEELLSSRRLLLDSQEREAWIQSLLSTKQKDQRWKIQALLVKNLVTDSFQEIDQTFLSQLYLFVKPVEDATAPRKKGKSFSAEEARNLAASLQEELAHGSFETVTRGIATALERILQRPITYKDVSNVLRFFPIDTVTHLKEFSRPHKQTDIVLSEPWREILFIMDEFLAASAQEALAKEHEDMPARKKKKKKQPQSPDCWPYSVEE